ncbi:hypothetical protein WQ54_10760 [Bacillus sp. SA1-12]|uniref:hypothetical protein n=1 Tax=Bacillus sp. SA1-12 TaxID=1455638 RepID=UPI0006266C10|nr:hypothetical protein [Bacillus sp. SA1-12]KKI92166.1 hypothetical protein WQ54_10760 [Bacillus sp. SA1-12]
MDSTLHNIHKNVVFPKDVIHLFTDIIINDPVSWKVFIYIGRSLKEQQKTVNHIRGITVNDIVENVKIERKERVHKGKTFVYQKTITNIDRKAAERIVDKLLDMSLLYYTPVKPYKFLYMSNRGWQITEEIINRKKENKNG